MKTRLELIKERHLLLKGKEAHAWKGDTIFYDVGADGEAVPKQQELLVLMNNALDLLRRL